MKVSFAAAVLCGGFSRRMGTDKAFLSHPNSRRPMWEAQLALLDELRPEASYLSANAAQMFAKARAEVLLDEIPDKGPLSGLATCLTKCAHPLLLVLAVDLPAMTSAPLRHLLDRCTAERGAVFTHQGYFEPLAAVYPLSMTASAIENLKQNRLRLQDWVRQGVEEEHLVSIVLPTEFESAFRNTNTLEELSSS